MDYVAAHPKELAAERERLYCLSKVRMAGENPETTYEDFRNAAIKVIESGDLDAAFSLGPTRPLGTG